MPPPKGQEAGEPSLAYITLSEGGPHEGCKGVSSVTRRSWWRRSPAPYLLEEGAANGASQSTLFDSSKGANRVRRRRTLFFSQRSFLVMGPCGSSGALWVGDRARMGGSWGVLHATASSFAFWTSVYRVLVSSSTPEPSLMLATGNCVLFSARGGCLATGTSEQRDAKRVADFREIESRKRGRGILKATAVHPVMCRNDV